MVFRRQIQFSNPTRSVHQIVEMQKVVIEDRQEQERLQQLEELARSATKVRGSQGALKRNVGVRDVGPLWPIAQQVNPWSSTFRCRPGGEAAWSAAASGSTGKKRNPKKAKRRRKGRSEKSFSVFLTLKNLETFFVKHKVTNIKGVTQ